ncbi:hypothetical protein CI109_103926 [Kwoniella shandongensis]|uniref:Uncharacterized protein n=1 Tax=Kwoniella shandongensis TaxID=1734106 RepID=A0A5M6BT52_9TREE|nr:uncharacterized protein CI109_005620 [Kwoniella shandongensis]KAA5526024.1 hypothetical protein CI109_005620 [Kwoniella shandongensis]
MALPPPGAVNFTPLLLDHLESHPQLHGWSLDPSLFSVLLLTLIVKRGGLVVDVEQEGVEKVVKVATAMTRHIFSLRTHHVDLDASTLPSEIPLRLLHHPPPPPKNEITPMPSRPSSSLRNPSTLRETHLGNGHAPTPTPTRSSSSHSVGLGINYHHEHIIKSTAELVVPEVLIVTGLEAATSPALIKFCDVLTKRRVEVGEGRWDFEPVVIWVREEGNEVPSWVIDHFMCGINISPEEVELPPPDLHERGVIPPSYIPALSSLLPYTHIHPPLFIHISNLLSAVSSHPSLKSTMTQRAVRAFPEYVKAHRLLSGGFDLPESFIDKALSPPSHLSWRHDAELQRTGTISNRQPALSGDIEAWAGLAGEEPDISQLATEGDEEKGPLEGWYATPANVQGVWGVCMGHRAKKREERKEVMWLMKGGAGGGVDKQQQVKGGNLKMKAGRGADRILDEILRIV